MSHVIYQAGKGMQKKDMITDFDTIWRTQDEIRTVVNAVWANASGISPMMNGAGQSFLS